jgi:hypothetical protein
MTWLKKWLLSQVKATAMKEIGSLDQYKPMISDIIKKNVDPDKTAEMVVNYVKDFLTKLVDKWM